MRSPFIFFFTSFSREISRLQIIHSQFFIFFNWLLHVSRPLINSGVMLKLQQGGVKSGFLETIPCYFTISEKQQSELANLSTAINEKFPKHFAFKGDWAPKAPMKLARGLRSSESPGTTVQLMKVIVHICKTINYTKMISKAWAFSIY